MKGRGMAIALVDLKAQYNSIKDEIDKAVRRVIQNGQFILGPEVKNFEQKAAAYCDSKYGIGVATGTDAIRLALLACGIKPGDEVITTPFTFVATVETVVQCGAVPVFADINPLTYNLEPAEVAKKITVKTKAILPVHLYGQAVDMDPLMELAQEHGLKVIEDAAQALGTGYKGRKVGSIGHAGCLSFFPTKNLGAYGDGGMVVTSDEQIATKIRVLRNHGAPKSYHYTDIGFNSRLDAMQAAILDVKLKYLDKWLEARRRNAALYNSLLEGIEGLTTPLMEETCYHSFNYYTLRLKDSAIPLCLHLQEAYKDLGYHEGDFPESEKAQAQVLSLPMCADLTETQIQQIAEAVRDFI